MLTLSCRARSLKRQDEMYQALKQFDIGRRSVVSAPIIAQLDLWEPSGDKLDEAECTLKDAM